MDVTTRQPVTAASLFHLASISKCVVAAAVLQLAEQGQIELDAPAAGYLPHFKMADERCRQVTVRQMLSHTGGMPDDEDHQWDRAEYESAHPAPAVNPGYWEAEKLLQELEQVRAVD